MFKQLLSALCLLALLTQSVVAQHAPARETKAAKDRRMAWWREARFGMFVHWGLYAIPAGAWKEETNHAEWIRTTARIPLDEYDQFRTRFNPVQFNAEAWVQMAKSAGMKYIVITSKHHDGFCLWNSALTDFDVMATPFGRDVLDELAKACRKTGMKLCFYHSIMDWHHPDYLPRRDWETNRPAAGADRKRYVAYLKGQLRELLTRYGDIGVLWFDGEWEDFWTHPDGLDLYRYVRSLQPGIIVNNRVDKGRNGMEGMTTDNKFAGDFGTPEQEIPARGIPGTDWESCMTMNDNWGFNKNDHHWKTEADLIRKLSDIASKGGNFLLNIGPTPEGTFPPEAIERLAGIGRWMQSNGEAIHGTTASPFESLPWGRVTQKKAGAGTRLYLHVWHWPADRQLVLPGIANAPGRAYLLNNPGQPVAVSRKADALVLQLPEACPDTTVAVVVLEVTGKPRVFPAPRIRTYSTDFLDSALVQLSKPAPGTSLRYTLDGSEPGPASTMYRGPVAVQQSCTIRARYFAGSQPQSGTASLALRRVLPVPALLPGTPPDSNFRYACYEGDWNRLPDFRGMQPVATGTSRRIDAGAWKGREHYGMTWEGLVRFQEAALYTFFLTSDDGSQLWVDGQLVVDNDGLHGMVEKTGQIPLAAGYHQIRVLYFEKTGGDDIRLEVETARMPRMQLDW